jgi:catechol 2,3-dioxygenase-like lactoylglutathione lyase family enzyme
MLTAVDHIDLKVPNLEQAETFFTGIGMRVVRRTADSRRSVELALPGENQVIFEIREDVSVTGTVIDHVAFRADSPATVEHLKGGGVAFTREHHLVVDTGRTVSNFVDVAGGKWQIAE